MDDEVQVGNSGSIAAQDFLKDGWNAIQFASPARLNLPLRKEAALNHMPSRPSTILERPRRLVGINAAGVNGARTRVIYLGRVTYVGEDAQGDVGKRTEETV